MMSKAKIFEKLVLPSGLTIYHHYQQQPWLYAYLVCSAGQRFNPRGKVDLAHYVEHMLHPHFGRHRRRNLNDLRHWLTENGVSPDLGETDIDHTAYGGQAPLVNHDFLFRFLNDLVRQPRFDCGFDKQREIIRAERTEMTERRLEQASRRLHRWAFGRKDNRPASRFFWPYDEDLDSLTPNDVRLFHRQRYGLAGMSLVVVGGLPLQFLCDRIVEIFPLWADEPPLPTEAKPFRFDKLKFRLDHCPLEGNDGEPASIEMAWHWFLPPSRGPVLALLRESLRSCLQLRLREQKMIAYGVDVETEHYRQHSALTVSTSVAPEQVSRARRIVERALTDRQAIRLEVPRQQLAYRLDLMLTDMNGSQIADEALADVILGLDPQPLCERANRLNRTTPDEVIALLDRRIRPDNCYLLTVEH